jgi:3-oxoacyl-[acyl-carrier-protein] synthase II
VVGLVPEGKADFQYDDTDPFVSERKYGRFIRYALVAAREALSDGNWLNLTEEQKDYTGITIGNGLGALDLIEKRILEFGQNRNGLALSVYGPYFIPSAIPNMGSGHLSIAFSLRGPNRSLNAACATGLYSLEDAASMIRSGDAKVVLTGASESTISVSAIAGFDAMRALSRNYNDSPSEASRPYSKGRDGFVLAEGAGMFLLEEYNHALERGAKIYAEYLASGLTGDAYHLSSPSRTGAERAMTLALRKSFLTHDKIDHINAHATSTPVGDESEVAAFRSVFQGHLSKIKISALKGACGHMLSAASAVESVFAVKTLQEQIVPPTLNIVHRDDFVFDLDIPAEPKPAEIEYLLKTSFGFGGTNAATILKRAPVEAG